MLEFFRPQNRFGDANISNGLQMLIIAVVLGFYAMHRLLAAKEGGGVEEGIVVGNSWSNTGKPFGACPIR